jgi:threonine/homoserine/homoserine lactone efflux protein
MWDQLGVVNVPLFVAAVFVLNATPGVDMLLAVGRTLQSGVRGGLAAAAGICAGCAVHAVAAAFGLAALLAVSALAFTAIKWAGAAYLLWLAVGMLRAAWRPQGAGAGPRVEPDVSLGAAFRQGLLTNVLNPKVALFVLAFLPQFIAADAPHKALAFLALGALLVLQGALFLVALVLVAARLRRLGSSPRVVRWLNATGAALFIGLAWRLASSRPAAP